MLLSPNGAESQPVTPGTAGTTFIFTEHSRSTVALPDRDSAAPWLHGASQTRAETKVLP